MSVNFGDIVQRWHDSQPSPHASNVKVGDYATAVKMAAALKFGGPHPTPQEVGMFWSEYETMNEALTTKGQFPLSPEEFQHLAQQAALSSYAYHGRPPTMIELQRLRDSTPAQIHAHYGEMPDKDYPTVSARDMAASLAVADHHSQIITGRRANKREAMVLHHSRENPADFYARLRDTEVPAPANGGRR